MTGADPAGTSGHWRTVRIDRRAADGQLVGEALFARVDGAADAGECGMCGAGFAVSGMLPHLGDAHPDLFAATASVDLTVLENGFGGDVDLSAFGDLDTTPAATTDREDE